MWLYFDVLLFIKRYTYPTLIIETIMDKRLLEILVCPLCKSQLQFETNKHELICKADRLAYPIRDDVPVMLVEEARTLSADEVL